MTLETTGGRRRVLITPEGVDLNLRLGEAGERAAAFLLDAAIIALSLILFSIMAVAALGAVGKKRASVVAIVWLLGYFVLRNLYFTGFELGPRAATPGKRMLGLRVAARDGGRLRADAVFARNAMREIEVYLPLTFLLTQGAGIDGLVVTLGLLWSGIFALFPLFNRDRLRVGDLVAGTWVVKAPKRKLAADLAGGETYRRDNFDFTLQQLDAYGVKELHVLEDVLRGGHRPTLGVVAERIRRKIGWAARPEESDREFLNAYYAGLRRRLESRLLFGHRRKDKFDRA